MSSKASAVIGKSKVDHVKIVGGSGEASLQGQSTPTGRSFVRACARSVNIHVESGRKWPSCRLPFSLWAVPFPFRIYKRTPSESERVCVNFGIWVSLWLAETVWIWVDMSVAEWIWINVNGIEWVWMRLSETLWIWANLREIAWSWANLCEIARIWVSQSKSEWDWMDLG